MGGTTRTVFVAMGCLLVGALLSPALAAAQQTQTVTGCLAKGEADGSYDITDAAGHEYMLSSSKVKLQDHVGHKVTVKGKASAMAHETGMAMAKDTGMAMGKDTEMAMAKDTGMAMGKDTEMGMAKDTGMAMAKDTGMAMAKHDDMAKDMGKHDMAGEETLEVSSLKMVSSTCK